MEVVNAFSFVQNSLSFIINAYADIPAWQAATQRLSGFEQQLLAIHQSKACTAADQYSAWRYRRCNRRDRSRSAGWHVTVA